MIETVPLSGRAGAFAGEAAGEELDAGEAMAEVSNIVKDSGSGPTAGETGAAFLVLLAEPEVVDASVGETEVEEPGSGEC